MVTALVLGCARAGEPPKVLVDGSRARAGTVDLEGIDDPVVASSVYASSPRDVRSGSRVAACLDDAWEERPGGTIVHRVGVLGESVTFLGSSRRSLNACDAAGTPGAPRRPWCGHSSGLLDEGSLRDPRLQLGGCTAGDARPVAFAWIEPGPRTRFVVVVQRGFSELYETSSDLAVRISTTQRVDPDRSQAVFMVSEHGADGRRLRAYELEARVSG